MAILHTDSLRIAYDEYGKGSKGTNVVLLHGCALNRIMWEPQVEALRGSHHLVVPDMRGHGASDIPGFVSSMERMADDVNTLVEAVDLAPAILVGFGMGGYIALQFAKKYPEKLGGLVLASARSSQDTPEDSAERHSYIQLLRSQGAIALAQQILPKLLSAETIAKEPELVAKVRRMIETTSAAGIAGALAGIASRGDMAAVLPTIAVPTFVFAGGADTRGVADAETLRAAIPGAQLSVIDGAGALFNLERPEPFNAILKPFLRDPQPGADPEPARAPSGSPADVPGGLSAQPSLAVS